MDSGAGKKTLMTGPGAAPEDRTGAIQAGDRKSNVALLQQSRGEEEGLIPGVALGMEWWVMTAARGRCGCGGPWLDTGHGGGGGAQDVSKVAL